MWGGGGMVIVFAVMSTNVVLEGMRKRGWSDEISVGV